MTITDALTNDFLHKMTEFGLTHEEIEKIIQAVTDILDNQPIQFELVE